MISALSECFLVNLEQEKKEEAAKGKKNILGDIQEGFKYLWQEKTRPFQVLCKRQKLI